MSGSAPGVVRRRRLDLAADPLDVLRRLRGQRRVVALLGEWRTGDVLAFDPLRELGPDDDPFDLWQPVVASGHGRFGGGWIGVWGYQLGRRLERVGEQPPRPVPQPDHRLAFYDRVLRHDDGRWWLEQLGGLVDPDEEERRAARFLDALERPAAPRPFSVGALRMTPSRDGHEANVRRVREHVAAGDVFQVNLTARLEAPFAGEPLDLFARGVETLRPAYAAFVDAPEGATVSLSPELFLRRTGDHVLTSPIKGTAPLTADPQALLASAKDRAENVMIADLMRNDLGRVAVPGSVRVPALVRLERHAVWHLVSDVVATLEPGTSHGDLLRATFPPGSVTGAPKVRAMQLIGEVEPTAREAYTGAVGHVGPVAGLELNVAIRTFEVADGRVWLGVGGGIVHDSDPRAEYLECLVKARPLVEAVGGSLADDVEPPAEPPAPVRLETPPAWRPDVRRGVFETMLVVDGKVQHLHEHLERLRISARQVLGVTLRTEVEASVLVRAAGLAGRHRLRVDARAGAGPLAPAFTVVTAPLDDEVPARTLTPRTVPGGLGAHKWADRSALRPVTDPSRDDLVLDVDGSVLEAGRAALLVVMDDGVHVPPLDGRVLPSTARARVLDRLRRTGVPVHEHRLTLDDVAAARELAVVNALRGAVPVVSVEGVGTWAPGPLTLGLGDPEPGPAADVVPPGDARVLVVDNYDSFVYNLVQHVGELGAATRVVRHDLSHLDDLVAACEAGEHTHVVVSPGPGAPGDAGLSVELVRRLAGRVPLLGVCLGHQAIAEAYGARVVRAAEVVHGKPSLVHHDGRGVHAGLPSPLLVGRYHSLVVDEASLPDTLQVTSRTASGLVMGVRHREHPVEGVQWHPESVLSPAGRQVLARFLARRD